MEIRYQVFENKNLLIQKFLGDFKIEHYIAYTRTVLSGLASKHIEKVLIDFRELEFGQISDDPHAKIDNMTKIRRQINEEELRNQNVKIVFWVNKPMPTAIIHLFIENFPKKDYNYCSTVDNVLGVLDLSANFIKLNELVDNLENKF